MSFVTVTLTEPGTLGLEFVSLSPPYIIKANRANTLNALPGDKLLYILKNELKISTDTLSWTQLVGILRDRPVSVVFERFTDFTSTNPPPRTVDASATYDVSLTLPGPLGLEFERTHTPWVVAVAKGLSQSLGIHEGDLLVAVDGESADHLSWEDLRTRLSQRPQLVTFRRGASIANVLNFFRPLVETVTGRSQQPTSPAVAAAANHSSPEASDDTTILEKLTQEVEYHKAETKRLQSVISETQEEMRTAVTPYEELLFEKQKEISTLNTKISELTDRLRSLADAEQRLGGMESRIAQLLNEKKEVLRENRELNQVVEQLLKKLQIALDEKPNFIDKRVLVTAVKEFLNFDGDTKIATRRLADKLGLTEAERAHIQPKPSVSDAFISFLADNTD